jgi:hypothetical protein
VVEQKLPKNRRNAGGIRDYPSEWVSNREDATTSHVLSYESQLSVHEEEVKHSVLESAHKIDLSFDKGRLQGEEVVSNEDRQSIHMLRPTNKD